MYRDFFYLTKKPRERIVPIIEDILDDLNYEEAAVNLPNKGFIEHLPDNISVEVPVNVNKNGVWCEIGKLSC